MTLLLALLLKSLLLFAISGLLLFALRRSSAAARSLVCLLTLGALLALPLFSLMLPGWRVPVAEPTPIRPSPALPVREGKESSPLAAAANSSAGAAASPIQLSPTAAPHSKSSLTGRTPAKQGGGFFLLGLLLASVRPLLGLWGIRRLSRTCLDIADPQTLTLAADCAHLLGLKTPPRLCVAAVPVPMTWGWRRPVIALPAASTDWPEDRLRSVLLHEMAHIKRRDWPAHRLADFACALYWFHPLVWLTARRLRSETELACDDFVLASGIPAPDYARHLLEIASALPRTLGRSNVAIAMAQTSKIESRLTMILDKTRPRRTVARRVLVFALVPATATLVILAVLRPDAKAQDAPEMAAVQSVSGTPVQLEGVTDGNHSGSRWWGLTGKPLSHDVYNTATFDDGIHLSSSSSKKVTFAFRIPINQNQANVRLDAIGSSATGGHHNAKDGSRWILTGAFPQSAKTALVRVGIASGAWTTAASNFTPAQNCGEGHDDVSCIFSAGVPSPHGGCAVTITTSNMKQDVRFLAVDVQGRQHVASGSTLGIGSMTQITLQFSLPLSQIKEVRVETRPFQWVQFKDVALQPVK